MKKTLCMLLILLFCLGAACAETQPAASAPAAEAAQEAPSSVILGFEDGFVLELPAGWQFYPVNARMAAQGVLYCLSDADAARWLYIQNWIVSCKDIHELEELIKTGSDPQNCGIYAFNGMDFVIYDLADSDVSCCAVLLDGRVYNFVFTPQSDAEFMGAVTQIISSFALLADE